MDPLIGADLLPEHGDVVVGRNQSIQGIDSFPRARGSMGTDTTEDRSDVEAGGRRTTRNAESIAFQEVSIGNGVAMAKVSSLVSLPRCQ